MKKYISILITIAVIALLLVLIFVLKDEKYDTTLSNDPDIIIDNARKQSKAAQKREDLEEMQELTIDEYFNYYGQSKKTIILISNTGYENCKISEPILKEIKTDKKLDIKVIYTDKLDENGNKKLYQLFESFGPPILTIVGNNSIISKVDGLTDKGHYLKFLEENGMLK